MEKFLKQKLKNKNLRLVFPEGNDKNILLVVKKLIKENICNVILIGEEEEISSSLKNLKINKNKVLILDPLKDEKIEEKIQILYEIRKEKNTLLECQTMMQENCYYGTMLVHLDLADALIAGKSYSTAKVLKPALQIIKAKPGTKTVSSSFLMFNKTKKFILSDCALVVEPSSEQLKDIAIASSESAQLFNIGPVVALLSYSSYGSGKGESVSKVKEAVKLLKESKVNFNFDGELQFDAAINKMIREKKAPGSTLKDNANVFIFPNLDAANITYKALERLGGYRALGPIIQGLRKPINDLSRGCSEKDIYLMSLITLLQASFTS